MDSDSLRIVVEVERGAIPISGQVRADGGTPRPFTGWTGLFAVLRAAAGEDPMR
jgi:hypothetical protein